MFSIHFFCAFFCFPVFNLFWGGLFKCFKVIIIYFPFMLSISRKFCFLLIFMIILLMVMYIFVLIQCNFNHISSLPLINTRILKYFAFNDLFHCRILLVANNSVSPYILTADVSCHHCHYHVIISSLSSYYFVVHIHLN